MNTFEANKVKVELKETTGYEYHIIPGTSETKDPKVTVDNTVDCYVFVKVTDTSDGAVTYELAEEWKKVDGYSDVYYREVSADAGNKEFDVLKDNQVSYSASLTNADMLDKDGNLREDIKLTFTAYAIQKIKGTEGDKNVEFSPEKAWEQIPVIVSVKTAEDFVKSVESAAVNEVVQLEEDIEINTAIPQSSSGTTNIDLNEKKLTVNSNSTTVSEGNLLTLENGTIEVKGLGDAAYSAISVTSGARLSVENVTMNVDGAALFPIGQDTEISVVNSEITSRDSYCVSTNAATPDNYGVKINLKDSTLKAPTAVMVNIPCSLTMENCKVEADMHGVVVRGGTAVIKDCEINNSGDGKYLDYFNNTNWGSGNMVNLAGITIGNKSTGYQYPSDVTLINTKVTSVTYPRVYMYGNADEKNGAVLTYDTASDIGEATYGGGYVVVNGEVLGN